MKTVYKYGLSLASPSVCLPKNAKFLFFGTQEDRFFIWAEVNTQETEKEEKIFLIVGTGYHLPDGCEWLGTTIAPPFVWHLYERKK